jgi:hypothetical protein
VSELGELLGRRERAYRRGGRHRTESTRLRPTNHPARVVNTRTGSPKLAHAAHRIGGCDAGRTVPGVHLRQPRLHVPGACPARHRPAPPADPCARTAPLGPVGALRADRLAAFDAGGALRSGRLEGHLSGAVGQHGAQIVARRSTCPGGGARGGRLGPLRRPARPEGRAIVAAAAAVRRPRPDDRRRALGTTAASSDTGGAMAQPTQLPLSGHPLRRPTGPGRGRSPGPPLRPGW